MEQDDRFPDGATPLSAVVDTLVRYHQLAGERTFFLTGTDEHGEKVAETASAAGITPKQAADRYSGSFRSAWDTLGFSFDRFIRTTDPDHQHVVQDALHPVSDAGPIALL